MVEEDENVERLRDLLQKRKDEDAGEYPGIDEDDEDLWLIDELDDLEDDSDEEEEDDSNIVCTRGRVAAETSTEDRLPMAASISARRASASFV